MSTQMNMFKDDDYYEDDDYSSHIFLCMDLRQVVRVPINPLPAFRLHSYTPSVMLRDEYSFIYTKKERPPPISVHKIRA